MKYQRTSRSHDVEETRPCAYEEFSSHEKPYHYFQKMRKCGTKGGNKGKLKLPIIIPDYLALLLLSWLYWLSIWALYVIVVGIAYFI